MRLAIDRWSRRAAILAASLSAGSIRRFSVATLVGGMRGRFNGDADVTQITW